MQKLKKKKKQGNPTFMPLTSLSFGSLPCHILPAFVYISESLEKSTVICAGL
jgi:hypothetical protein